MKNTLILYESRYGTTKKVAETIGYLVGNTRVRAISAAPTDLSGYENIIFTFGFYGPDTAAATQEYIKGTLPHLTQLKIGLIGVALTMYEFPMVLEKIESLIGRQVDLYGFVPGELVLSKLTKEDYDRLKEFSAQTGFPLENSEPYKLENGLSVAELVREMVKVPEASMDKVSLRNEIYDFISSHNTCCLSTGYGTYTRCTPLEYILHNECLYILTEGGMKFKGILQNKQVSLGIYEDYINMATVKGLQITGVVEIVPLYGEEYYEVLNRRGVKPGVIDKLKIDLYILKIRPKKYEYLNAELRKRGFDAVQILSED